MEEIKILTSYVPNRKLDTRQSCLMEIYIHGIKEQTYLFQAHMEYLQKLTIQ